MMTQIPNHIAPNHIAIIMDGNRRWAHMHSLPTHYGHEKGALNVEHIARAAHERGVRWLTLFAFSTENWRRSPLEIRTLMSIFRQYLKTRIDRLLTQNIHLRVIGDRSRFPADINAMIDESVVAAAGNTGLNLTIALGYGGKADLATAARRLAEKAKAGDIDPSNIDDAAIKGHLSTADLPPVDLLIRTGREHRISNFLIWDMAYAELAFSEAYWPDFNADDLGQFIETFADSERRFGGDGLGHTRLQKMAT